MIPSPTFVWLYTGTWPFSVFGVKASQVRARYGAVFAAGARQGWHPLSSDGSGIFVEIVGNRDGEETFRISHYSEDPRPAWAAAAQL